MTPSIFPVFIMLPLLILLLLVVVAVIVLFIKLCSKRPWIAAVAALVLLLLLVPVFVLIPVRIVSRRPVVSQDVIAARSEDTTAAIWLPGIEDEFEANVYPSELSAVRSLGLRIDEPVRELIGEVNLPPQITLFQEVSDRTLILELKNAIQQAVPEATCAIEAELRNLDPNEVGVTMWVVGRESQAAPWARSPDIRVANGIIQANVFTMGGDIIAQNRFVEKPWVEDFSGFLNAKPNCRFIIAKSTGSCMTEAEANHQALENACAQLTELLDHTSRAQAASRFARKVISTDILKGNFILDRFVQSFKGTAGRIWRQALLIDASVEKLEQLAHRKAVVIRTKRRTWAGMFLSIVGLFVLIIVVYAFLNAATKGYYVWSLRVAGIVLALITIILLLV